MEVSEGLKKLARIIYDNFKTPLFIVGGKVRNHLIGLNSDDTDICASLPSEKLKELSPEFLYREGSKKLNTAVIIYKNEHYEFTSFRKDSYSLDGKHEPNEIKLTNDIKEDALRRDFTINAIYYDILKEEYVDPLNGIGDIKRKIIKTTRKPKEVFSEDGLRLLRLVRFAAGLGFDIEEKTFEGAKECADKLKSISYDRIGEELKKISLLDNEYKKLKYAHYEGLMLADKLGILEIILPELCEGKGIMQKAEFHKYDVFMHSLLTYKYSDKSIRLVALLHDIGKPPLYKENKKTAAHSELGAKTAREILTKLRYPKNEGIIAERLIKYHAYDLKGKESSENVRLFVQRNFDICQKLIKLKECDALAKREEYQTSISAVKLKKAYDELTGNGVPLKLSDLPINGREVIEIGYEGEEIKEGLGELLMECAKSCKKMSRKECIKYLKEKRSLNHE